MKLEEAKEIIKNSWLFDSANENIGLKEALSTALQEIERLQKENIMLNNITNNCPHYNTSGISCDKKFCNLDDYISKDKIREKIDNRISTIENLLDEMVDKSIGCINVSYLSKKEKEKVILKRNCLTVQKATLIDIKKDLLKEE